MQHCAIPDGAYWTGWQYENQAPFRGSGRPGPRRRWCLAADALAGYTAAPGSSATPGRPDWAPRDPDGPDGMAPCRTG